MGQFNCYAGVRVGEAARPGPSTDICVTNPTALVGKVQEIAKLPHDVFMFAETSATSAAQRKVGNQLGRQKLRCFWSHPVSPLKATALEDFSYRGEAIGTAIMSRIPCRSYRGHIPELVWKTCRINAAVLQLKCCEVLLVVVYGFPDNKTREVRQLNNRILASAYNVVSHQNLPYIVAGDFNTPIHDLQAFELFQNDGCCEAFHFYKQWKGHDLPPTCKQTTRNDTAIIHPFLKTMIKDIRIDDTKPLIHMIP